MPASKIFLTIKHDTKEEEKEIINGLLDRLGYNGHKLEDPGIPDYELKLDNKSIGVEVTKYYADKTKKGSTSQKKLSEWVKFANDLKKKLSDKEPDLEYLYGAIHFHNKNVEYKVLLQDKYLNELITFIKSTGLKTNGKRTVRIGTEKFPSLSEYIESIFLWDTNPNKNLWWDASLQSGEVIKNESAIKLIVGEKEEKSKKYKNNYFQKWLVIYAAGLGLGDMFIENSQDLTIQEEVCIDDFSNSQKNIYHEIKSNYFTHIFIWDKFSEKIFQLFPYYKKIFDSGEKKIWVNHLPLKS